MINSRLLQRLYDTANASRWGVDRDRFAQALDASAAKALAGRAAHARELERYLAALHLEDLALACACAEGHEGAWQHFVLTHRTVLYRCADAIDPTGEARELADSLYADLFGLGGRSGERQSLFRYFHGRSSLATWLRAVLSQRHVDRIRERKRIDPLPDEDSAGALVSHDQPPDPERPRFLSLMRAALPAALAALDPRDRLRVACYYAQQMTLAQTGQLLGEHEATVSRQLSRTRAAIRLFVERYLEVNHGLSDVEMSACFASLVEDAGPLDLEQLLDTGGGSGDQGGAGDAGKNSGGDRSRRGRYL